jgi:hypothetical protein
MWKPTLEMTGIKCLRTGTLKPRWNYFFQIKKTLPNFLKDEIKKKEKKEPGQVNSQNKWNWPQLNVEAADGCPQH